MDRSRLYKNKFKDTQELRRRRVDQSVELRKAKKEEQLQKRRNVILTEQEETSPLKNRQVSFNIFNLLQICSEPVWKIDDIISGMKSNDMGLKFSSTQQCRKALSKAKDPPIQAFFERGAIDVLSSLLDNVNHELVFEATWALTNIASGDSEHTRGVVESGVVPKFIKLLKSRHLNIAEQSVWAIGNIAGEGAHFRDLLTENGAIPPIIDLLHTVWETPTIVSNIAWVLSNFCRNRDPPPKIEVIRTLLPVLKELLKYSKSQDVLADTAWAISYASDNFNGAIEDILKHDITPLLIRLISSHVPNLISPSLRALGNLVTGSDEQTQIVLNNGLLLQLKPMFLNKKHSVVKETCWIVSNVTAGTREQIQYVIDSDILPLVLSALKEGEFRTQKEACWVIYNMANGASDEQIVSLIHLDTIDALSSLLHTADVQLLLTLLKTYSRIFEVASLFGLSEKACISMESCGGLDKLEALQDHDNEEVYKIAYNMIDLFFNEKEDEETNDAPTDEKQEPIDTIQCRNQQEDDQEFRFSDQQPHGQDFQF